MLFETLLYCFFNRVSSPSFFCLSLTLPSLRYDALLCSAGRRLGYLSCPRLPVFAHAHAPMHCAHALARSHVRQTRKIARTHARTVKSHALRSSLVFQGSHERKLPHTRTSTHTSIRAHSTHTHTVARPPRTHAHDQPLTEDPATLPRGWLSVPIRAWTNGGPAGPANRSVCRLSGRRPAILRPG